MNAKVIKYQFCILSFLLFVSFIANGAERLPVKVYTAADGLASSVIHHVAKDSQGFLWFSARGGLSRFDGYEFTSYRLDGEPSSLLIHFFMETRDGKYWIATDSGLYRADRKEIVNVQPVANTTRSGERRLNAKKVSNRVFWALYEDQQGRLWAGLNNLYLIENRDAEQITLKEIDFNPTAKRENRIGITDITESSDGSVWANYLSGMARILPDGRCLSYEVPRLSASESSRAVHRDLNDRIWFSHTSGVFIIQPEPINMLANVLNQTVFSLPVEEQEVGNTGAIKFPSASGKMLKLKFKETENTKQARAGQAANFFVEDLYQTSDGKLWLPTKESLYVFEGENYKRLTDSNSLPGAARRIVEDLQGNLWFGTSVGVVKYKRNGLITFDQASGLLDPSVYLIQETPNNELLVTHGTWRVSRLTSEGVESARLNLPENARYSWTAYPSFQDSTGAIWALTFSGLYRFAHTSSFASLVGQKPQNITADNIGKDENMYRAFSDSQGNVWFSVRGEKDNKLLKYNPRTNEWRDYTNLEGYPKGHSVVSFAEDSKGNLWFGFYDISGMIKLSNDKLTFIGASAEGLQSGAVFALHVDKKGRLWAGTTREGLSRIDNPAAEKLEFVRYTENEGLISNIIRCLTEDLDGNVYAGTVRGVTRINAETGQMRNYTTADGLAADFVQTAFRDSRGTVWFGTSNGLSKLEPTKEQQPPAPQIFISDLQIAGVNYALSEFGQREIGGVEVGATDNNLQINFFSVGESGSLRYQYKLEGATQQDWSKPSEQRAVNFANLASGSYRFLVRAVNDAGVASENPAVVSFTIHPPFWKRWWFIALMILIVGAAVFALDRYRVSKTRQVEAALEETERAGKIIQESETRYRTLAETASDAIITIDSESCIIYINEAAENIFGYKSDELTGKPLVVLMPERFRKSHEFGIKRYLTTNKRNIKWASVELPGLHKDGHEVPLELSFGEFEKDGERFFTGIARDITERKKAEAALQKAREERIAELQRVRTRIATDLHDDIGSSLTQIAVFSELARQKADSNGKENEPIDLITTVANELVDTMSDIVWAINPRKDHLQDLTQRMRRFAADVMTAKDIDLEFLAPDSEHDVPLGANIRREVFLIFKESVNNIVKHSEATEAKIEFSLNEDNLTIQFKDNGKGFDPKKTSSNHTNGDWKKFRGGNGLLSMKKRAEDLGGEYLIDSEIGKGTSVSLSVPLEKK